MLYADLTKKMMEEHTLIINTTPLGTSPNVARVPAHPIRIYHRTPPAVRPDLQPRTNPVFASRGTSSGAATKNGYEMLILQAEKSWEIWKSNEVVPMMRVALLLILVGRLPLQLVAVTITRPNRVAISVFPSLKRSTGNIPAAVQLFSGTQPTR
jgi:hypothetical protein